MHKKKTRNPPMSERNNVLWASRDLMFIREHSIDYPKPSWAATNSKSVMIGLISYFAAMIVAAFVPNMPLKIASIFASTIIFTLHIADSFSAHMRENRLITSLLDRGGIIVDSWNATVIKRNGTTAQVVALSLVLVFYATMGLLIFRSFTGHLIDTTTVLAMLNCTNCVNIFNSLYNNQIGPFIFMDIEEGMFFGGALFTYDVMSGLQATVKRNGFELHFEGNVIASGKMLPDDMNYLRDIIEIRNKYKRLLDRSTDF